MNSKLKGTLYAVISAVSYGTNPLGALSLYKEGVNANSVLFYRFSLAAIILGGLMLVQKKSFQDNSEGITYYQQLRDTFWNIIAKPVH